MNCDHFNEEWFLVVRIFYIVLFIYGQHVGFTHFGNGNGFHVIIIGIMGLFVRFSKV